MTNEQITYYENLLRRDPEMFSMEVVELDEPEYYELMEYFDRNTPCCNDFSCPCGNSNTFRGF